MRSLLTAITILIFATRATAQFYGSEREIFMNYMNTHPAFASYTEDQKNRVPQLSMNSHTGTQCAKYVVQYMTLSKIASTNTESPMSAYVMYHDLAAMQDYSFADRLMPDFKAGKDLDEEKERKICIATVNRCKTELARHEKNLTSCNNLFKMAMEDKDIKNEDITWAGTWEGNMGYGTYRVVVTGHTVMSYSATTTHAKNNGYTDQGAWTGCERERDTIICKWTEKYEDQDKIINRKGILRMGLSFDTMSGYAIEDEPSISWKPGVAKYTSAMKKNARWPITVSRKIEK